MSTNNYLNRIVQNNQLDKMPQNLLVLSCFCADLDAMTIELANGADDNEMLERWLHDIKLVINDSPNLPYDIGHTVYPAFLASAFVITKRSPKLVNLLSVDEVTRMDFLMEVMMYLSAFASNDCNDFKSTLELHGDFNKFGGVNYKFSAVSPMICAMIYFQDENDHAKTRVNQMLEAFDVDDVLDRANNYGYTALVERWNTSITVGDREIKAKDYLGFKSVDGQKEIMYYEAAGNLAYGGKGCGINVPYTYNNEPGDELVYLYDGANKTSSVVRMMNYMLYHCFRSDHLITSEIDENGDGVPEVFISDHSKSPVEGKHGLMFAFNDNSPYPRLRSSAMFAQLEASMAMSIIATLTTLDAYFSEDKLIPTKDFRFELTDCPSTFECVNNGMIDAIYKLEHGYMSKSMGRYYTWQENSSWGWLYWKQYFNENVRRDEE